MGNSFFAKERDLPPAKADTTALRKEVVAAYENDDLAVTDISRRHGCSRKTGYKWLNRYLQTGDVSDRSRRPHHCPSAIDPALEAEIVAARIREPSLGAKRLRAALARQRSSRPVPSISTITRIFKRHGLVGATTATSAPRPAAGPLRGAH
jgi:transposase-like protein